MEQEEVDTILNHYENCIGETNHQTERDWTQEEIDLFVNQFCEYNLQTEEEPKLDMEKLDPRFVTEEMYKEKFSGFDDNVIEMLTDLENKKLEDTRIPPLKISRESVKLVNSLSDTIYNDKETEASKKDNKSKTECIPDC